jgi:hypothetical protein
MTHNEKKVMKEPPMGSVVVDIRGSAWQRHPVGWAVAGSDMSWSYTWKQLLKELYSPMDYPSQEWAPVLHDPRLPLIVYVPHEELLLEEEDNDE